MYTKILVPTDGSKLSNRAISEAAGIATLCGAKLLLLHVQQPFEGPRGAYPGLGVAKHMKDAQREAGEKVVAAAAKAAGKAVAITKVVQDYSPYNAIIKAAKKEKCDLIVMASHGRSGLSEVLVGSETQKVLTHTTIPVLVVR